MAGCATCLHKNVHPNICSVCLGGTHFNQRIKKTTNGDRIRAMTDEELAQHLYWWDNSPLHASPERWLDWLKEEVDDATD